MVPGLERTQRLPHQEARQQKCRRGGQSVPALQGLFGPGFEDLFDFGHELVGEGAIDQAVVEA